MFRNTVKIIDQEQLNIPVDWFTLNRWELDSGLFLLERIQYLESYLILIRCKEVIFAYTPVPFAEKVAWNIRNFLGFIQIFKKLFKDILCIFDPF